MNTKTINVVDSCKYYTWTIPNIFKTSTKLNGPLPIQLASINFQFNTMEEASKYYKSEMDKKIKKISIPKVELISTTQSIVEPELVSIPEQEDELVSIPEQTEDFSDEEDLEVVLFEKENKCYEQVSSTDKPVPEIKKKCTKFCDSIVKNIPCKHGVNCSFSHSISDVNPFVCSYGKNCAFTICKENGCFLNKSTTRMCERIHEGETKFSYLLRFRSFSNQTLFVKKSVEHKPVPVEHKAVPVHKPVQEKIMWADLVKLIVPKQEPIVPEIIESPIAEPEPEPQPEENDSEWKEVKKIVKQPQKPAKVESAFVTQKYRKLCESVLTHTTCKFGAKCAFAHKAEQLTNILPCSFDCNCKKVIYSSNSLKNTDVLCTFKHSCETSKSYIARINSFLQ